MRERDERIFLKSLCNSNGVCTGFFFIVVKNRIKEYGRVFWTIGGRQGTTPVDVGEEVGFDGVIAMPKVIPFVSQVIEQADGIGRPSSVRNVST